MSKTHELKTWPTHFENILRGTKTFEVRKDDRPFQFGDTVILKEYDKLEKMYTGRSLEFQIGNIIHGAFGLRRGYCAFSLLTNRIKK